MCISRSIPKIFPIASKVVNYTKLFGLLKFSKVVSEQEVVQGPDKDEICIVVEEYLRKDVKYYRLAGYPYGGYNAKYFIRLDEFTETQKEIAKKSEPVFN